MMWEAISRMGTGDDTLMLQRLIDRKVSSGGGTIEIPRGVYTLTAPLVLNMGSSNVNVRLVGDGNFATKIVQTNPNADVFQLGATAADVGEQISLSDMWITGGRYSVNMNNCLSCIVERMRIENAQVGIYLQGLNEGHVFRDLAINGMQQHGIWGAVSNGGPGVLLDLPEIQKCKFENIRVAGTRGGTAIVITAVGQSSGFNSFRNILCESNSKGTIEFHFCFNTWVDGLSTEEQLDADNVYTSFLVTDLSTVYARHLSLSAVSPNNFQYQVNVPSGHLSIKESSIGAARTADIRVNDNVTMDDSYVVSGSSLLFTTTQARNRSLFTAMRDSSGVPLTIQ